MTTNLEAIRFEQVHYTVDSLHILKNITGSFPKGEITTLVGPSGAGKTTLFRLCNGLKSPSSGEIYIHGKTINSYDPAELRQNVGIALQNATMINGSVRKNLELPLTLQGKALPQKDAEELMHVVGLDKDFLKRNSKDLSGGQRQKLSIARTLVNRPKILLLDEITSSLDRVSQQDIEKLIGQINQEYGTTIIWITHNLEQALTIGKYTWVMMNGELIETGTSDLLRNPENDKVKRFVKGEVE
ncbi:ATP-binding cassette domain-containing protein [Virgibacillus dakarensis]|uniref:ABC transporter ATP-binding protein YjkB n=1 Tax=Lentibacillus populi TaxID=1827502 RepID=A0A9W5X4V8_9BACI|nr:MULTISPECIES: phosphate ABC transporter ATP-binding protein [Bacillaceae]MBT2214353.1 phosphate ABC transporter ATP-binding protein [Virgibacillus dakarensis]MTW85030.1 ATP-binding cassette domain-containing protein [Virgibacillus dakarensis]GGB34204.1 putative ABC transporter ATP-binding protein YjkB [Lentibacillus populi]